ncbi:hypothetical protein KE530_13880 [Clostridiaceae bacterium Marseille-Q4145]|mgnify:CR=1 FL=1|nr:hypothetical protein [Clostridiaceae bacterium Marseille-Q4145]
MEIERTVRVESNIDEVLHKVERLNDLLKEAKHLADELASSEILEFEVKV